MHHIRSTSVFSIPSILLAVLFFGASCNQEAREEQATSVPTFTTEAAVESAPEPESPDTNAGTPENINEPTVEVDISTNSTRNVDVPVDAPDEDESEPTNTTPIPEETAVPDTPDIPDTPETANTTDTVDANEEEGEEEAEHITVDLRIQSPNGSAQYSIQIADNSTVEAVMKAAIKKGFSYTSTKNGSMGAFVKSIHGLSEDRSSRMYWIFYVNGSRSALGISTKKIHSQDIIEWKYEKEF